MNFLQHLRNSFCIIIKHCFEELKAKLAEQAAEAAAQEGEPEA